MISLKAIGIRQVTANLDRLAKRDLRRGILDGLEGSARLVEANVKREQLSGDPVKVRSGRLRSSVRTDINKRALEARVGTNVEYARAIEEGAVITPKKARALAIPLKAALTAAGRSRGGPREVGRLYRQTFIRKSEPGKPPILYGKNGPKSKPVPLFVLVKRVTIKARHPFERATRATGVGITQIMGDAVQKAIDG